LQRPTRSGKHAIAIRRIKAIVRGGALDGHIAVCDIVKDARAANSIAKAGITRCAVPAAELRGRERVEHRIGIALPGASFLIDECLHAGHDR